MYVFHLEKMILNNIMFHSPPILARKQENMVLAIQSRLEVMAFTPSYTANGLLEERYLAMCVIHHVPENSIHGRSQMRVERGVSYERWWLPVWTRVAWKTLCCGV